MSQEDSRPQEVLPEPVTPEVQPVSDSVPLRSWELGAAILELETSPYGAHTAFEEPLRRYHGSIAAARERFADDPAALGDIEEVAEHGRLNGVLLSQPMGTDVTPTSVGSKASRLLDIYAGDPSMARELVEQRISGFHGSRSSALLDTMRFGLMPGKDVQAHPEIVTATGERTFGPVKGQGDISFVDWSEPESLAVYASFGQDPNTIENLTRKVAEYTQTAEIREKSPHQWEQDNAARLRTRAAQANQLIEKLRANENPVESQLIEENFPVAYGISADDFSAVYETVYDVPEQQGDTALVRRVRSDIKGEFAAVSGSVEPDKIRMIAVPQEQVDRVRQTILEQVGREVHVVPLEALYAPRPTLK